VDSFVLTGANGTTLNIGSYVRPDPGPDFGSKDLVKAYYAQNAISEGGVLGFEDVGVRSMTFPMLLPSSSVFGGLQGLEGWIRQLARPGAVLDLLVDGVATADAVRFDVLTGRLEEDYSIHHNRVDKRTTTLRLDVQPIGYSPTLILLASAASIGLPGVLTISAGSVGGDWPGQAELLITPTAGPTTYGPASWYPDMLGWSLGGRPSHVGYWQAASLISVYGGTVASLIGDFAAPASQALAWNLGAAFINLGSLSYFAHLKFVTGSGPFLEGRHRVYAYAKLTPSQLTTDYLAADLVYDSGAALASAQPLATLAPAVASGAPGAWGAQPSSGYQLLDLGEVQPEAQASGFPGAAQYLRLWWTTPSLMVATQTVQIGGVYLLPQDGPAGILPRGVVQPTIGAPSTFTTFDLDARAPQRAHALGSASGPPISNLGARYRGGMPYVGASTVRLDLLGGDRKAAASGATSPVVYGSRAFAAVSVRYRPRFLFLKGI
jgi:hypothetical protein